MQKEIEEETDSASFFFSRAVFSIHTDNPPNKLNALTIRIHIHLLQKESSYARISLCSELPLHYGSVCQLF